MSLELEQARALFLLASLSPDESSSKKIIKTLLKRYGYDKLFNDEILINKALDFIESETDDIFKDFGEFLENNRENLYSEDSYSEEELTPPRKSISSTSRRDFYDNDDGGYIQMLQPINSLQCQHNSTIFSRSPGEYSRDKSDITLLNEPGSSSLTSKRMRKIIYELNPQLDHEFLDGAAFVGEGSFEFEPNKYADLIWFKRHYIGPCTRNVVYVGFYSNKETKNRYSNNGNIGILTDYFTDNVDIRNNDARSMSSIIGMYIINDYNVWSSFKIRQYDDNEEDFIDRIEDSQMNLMER